MEHKNYLISKQSLQKLMYYVNEMFNIGTFIQQEYKKETNGDFRKEVLSDGVFYRLDTNHKEVSQLINIICNDDKIIGDEIIENQ